MVKTAQADNDTFHLEAAPDWVKYRNLLPVDKIPVDDLVMVFFIVYSISKSMYLSQAKEHYILDILNLLLTKQG